MQKLYDNAVSIVWLKPMRVLSSFLKDSYIEEGYYYTSDAKGFYAWIDANLPVSVLGSHEVFDFQNTFIRDKYQPAAMKKISEDFVNVSPYTDYVFGGGLYAAMYAFIDENVGAQHNRLKLYIDNSPDYEIDYLPDGNQRHESPGEPVISPDITRNRLAIYIPVKLRSNAAPKNRIAYDNLIGGPNIGRTEPSKDTYYKLMDKLQSRNK